MAEKQKFKDTLKSIWNFLWKDESFASWVISLALAFIIVKFIFYPALSFIFASPMPLVVVESYSMFHQGSAIKTLTAIPLFSQDRFDSWWQNRKEWYEGNSINYNQAEQWRFETGLDKGDIILLYGSKNLKIGDIIVFNANSQAQRYPVIHRIVKISQENGETIYETKGDNNEAQIPFETTIHQEDIIGKAILRIPKIGWIKLVFVEIIRFFSPNLI